MNGNEPAQARIVAQLDASFSRLEKNGTNSSKADEVAEFLVKPGTLKRPSLIVRCRFDRQSFDVSTIVDKPYSRRRVIDGLLPCLARIKAGLVNPFDVFVLISDMVYIEEAALAEYVDLLGHVPFLRCDWLEGDVVSSSALIMPDLWLQEDVYGCELNAIKRAAKALPFEDRRNIIKWRGGLSGPGYPDIENCLDFPRYHLLREALRKPEIVDARLTHYDNLASSPAGEALRERLESWFGGKAPHIPIEDFTKYKYLASFDGVAASWKRVASILWSGSVLLMQHRWRQFFYPGLVEWEHYVPVADDASDLVARYEWLEANPDRAISIARKGTEFARRFLTQEAVDSYMQNLLNRCGRLPSKPRQP